jgi:hypothetical protein
LLDEINTGKRCTDFDKYNGLMVVDSIYINGALFLSDQVIISSDKTMITFKLGAAIV